MSDRDELLSLVSTADRMNVTPRTLRYWSRHYGFPLFLVKGHAFCWWGEVEQWVRAGAGPQ